MKVNKLDSKVLLKNANIIDPLKESQSKADILLVEGQIAEIGKIRDLDVVTICLLYTSPSPRDATLSRMPSSA